MKTIYGNQVDVTRYVSQGAAKSIIEGGVAVHLTNKTGGVSVKGTVVRGVSSSYGNVGDAYLANDSDPLGVIYESGIADGEKVWVVIYGIVNVLLKDNTGSTYGYWIGIDDESGYAYATEFLPPDQPEGFREIGYCTQTVTATGGGTHVLCRITMSFY